VSDSGAEADVHALACQQTAAHMGKRNSERVRRPVLQSRGSGSASLDRGAVLGRGRIAPPKQDSAEGNGCRFARLAQTISKERPAHSRSTAVAIAANIHLR
jgi:hypothetical protein